ncbi:MAG TPA: hypothetical protein VJ797_13190 [Burkholderiales bacterium]|nr:hypothetical protein [Burkholderiales bacterium]
MEARTSVRRSGAYAAAVALVLGAPLAAFLTGNHYPVLSAEAGLLLAGCVAAGVLLQGVAWALGAAGAALVLAAALALAVDLLSGASFGYAGLAALGAACFAATWLLGRRAVSVAAVAASAFLASTLLIPGTAADDRAGAPQGEKRALPVVLHLVLDEHIGLAGLPEDVPESAGFGRWLTEAYVGEGFRVHAGAYSQYFLTRHSIANLLNFSTSAQPWAHLVEGRSHPHILTGSAYFRHLSALGYRLHVYQSDYLDYCRIPGIAYASCSTYRANSIGALRDTALGTLERAQFIFNSLAASSGYLAALGRVYEKLTGSSWPRPVSRVGPLPVLPVLQRLASDLRSASPGEAYFAHLLLPHYPYVLDRSCRLRAEIEDWLSNVPPGAGYHDAVLNSAGSRNERYRRYFEQVRCQQLLLGRLFDAMREANVWHDAIVIIHGDHGSRIVQRNPLAAYADRLTRQDFNDAFSTLFAIRSPRLKAGVERERRPLQELLAEALGLPMERLPANVYLAGPEGRPLTPRSLAQF